MKISMYQVDAFTHSVFGGNPAAVCLLDHEIPAELMQQIAAENNLAETAFLLPQDSTIQIRWFTPTVEVDLCGHATLASAHVLFQEFRRNAESISFYSPRSGALSVSRSGDWLTLDFPVDQFHQTDAPPLLEEAIGRKPLDAYRGKTDYLLIYPSEVDIASIDPDMALLKRAGGRGVIVSAPGDHCDFVSRFFAPQSGIDEDPVTGSAHTTLTPYWSNRLGKKQLTAQQISKRGGDLRCEDKGDRILISGQAVTFFKGQIEV
ncbi:PhzF family phenazine biosynthesis protein [bacterium SCSIO 12741]|nr:PhzF family phenazine biosynthesis protein [bacterium SCSIO 12741]